MLRGGFWREDGYGGGVRNLRCSPLSNEFHLLIRERKNGKLA